MNNEFIHEVIDKGKEVSLFQATKNLELPHHSMLGAEEFVKMMETYKHLTDEDTVYRLMIEHSYRLGYLAGFKDKEIKQQLDNMDLIADYYSNI